jgi:hypothetical protein
MRFRLVRGQDQILQLSQKNFRRTRPECGQPTDHHELQSMWLRPMCKLDHKFRSLRFTRPMCKDVSHHRDRSSARNHNGAYYRTSNRMDHRPHHHYRTHSTHIHEERHYRNKHYRNFYCTRMQYIHHHRDELAHDEYHGCAYSDTIEFGMWKF